MAQVRVSLARSYEYNLIISRLKVQIFTAFEKKEKKKKKEEGCD